MDNDELKDKFDEIMEKAKVLAGAAGKKAEEYAKVIGDKASEWFDAAKRKLEAEKIMYALNKKYKELGKAYYEAKEAAVVFDDTEIATDIKTLKEALEVLKTADPDTVAEAEAAVKDDEEQKF